MPKPALLACAFALLLAASPALAHGEAQVPEGSSFTLFALGILGVLVGRRGARRPRDGGEQDTE